MIPNTDFFSQIQDQLFDWTIAFKNTYVWYHRPKCTLFSYSWRMVAPNPRKSSPLFESLLRNLMVSQALFFNIPFDSLPSNGKREVSYSMQRGLWSLLKFISPVNYKLLSSPVSWEPHSLNFYILPAHRLCVFCLFTWLSKIN